MDESSQGAPRSSSAHSRGALGLGLAIALLLGLYALVRLRFEPPAPCGPETPEGEFSAARALETLGGLIGDRAPHPVGSVAHERLRAKIVDELAHLGWKPEVQETLASSGNVFAPVKNVVAVLEGRTDRGAVLVCAHYDSVAAGPGAGDDGAGVAAMLEIARALKAHPPAARPIVLLIDDGEEMGLLGAEGFCARSPLASRIEVVVNLEARGTSGLSAMFETSAGNDVLIDDFARSVERPSATSAAYEVYKRLPNDTDLTVFKRRGLAGFNFAFIGGLRHYHTPLDDLDHLDPGSLQHHGDNALALTLALASDGHSLYTSPPGDTVYTDVLGWTLIRWPDYLSLPFAVAALVVIAGTCVRARRWRDVAAGALVCALAPLASALVGLALTSLVRALRVDPLGWPANPVYARLALSAASLSAGTLLAAALLRRASVAGAWLGVWLALSIASVLASMFVNGASYLLILPCAIAAACAPIVRRASLVIVLVSIVPAALVWMPLIHGLELALEFRAGAALAAGFGLLSTLAMPCLASSPRSIALRLSAVAALVASVALGSSFFAPLYTPEQPAALNILHVMDAEAGSARFLVRTYGLALPESVRVAGGFTEARCNPFPWWSRSTSELCAPADSAPVLPPVLEITEHASHGQTRSVTARVRSPRAARHLVLELRPGVKLASASWRGTTLAGGAVGGAVDFVGFGIEGIDIRLEIDGDAPIDITLLDTSSDLPPVARPLLDARPEDRVPRGEGDLSIVHRRVRI